MTQTDLPPLNWLRTFEAASRHLSFTDAGRELGLTQSAVSQQIKSLEGFLGTPLFYRRVRSLEITDAGRGYLPVVQEAFVGLSAATRTLRGSDQDTVLQVQSNMSFAVYWLTPRLPRLFDQCPWLNVVISPSMWDPERTASAADVEVRLSKTFPDGNADLLSRDVVFPVCGSETDITRETLFDQYLFDCSGFTANWPNWCKAAGITFPKDQAVTYASTLAIPLHAAQRHAGVALGHGLFVRDLLEDGLLKRPFETELPLQEAYYLIVAGGGKTRAKQAFADWIKDEMAL